MKWYDITEKQQAAYVASQLKDEDEDDADIEDEEDDEDWEDDDDD